MQKEHFGKICASLRQDKFNPVARRMWSQADLANASNLPLRLIGQIERGERVILQDDILVALADAFELTKMERERFFWLRSTILDRVEDVQNAQLLTNLSKEIELQHVQQPALLYDGFYRILDMNEGCRKVYGLTKEYFDSVSNNDPTKYHLTRLVHDAESPLREIYLDQIESIEVQSVIYWKYLSLAYRHTGTFSRIQTILLSKYQKFAYLWNSLNFENIEMSRLGLVKSVESLHPRLGLVKYIVMSHQVYSNSGEIYMTLLVPTNPDTASIFCNL